MPFIKINDVDYEFKVDMPELPDKYPSTKFFFLKRNLMVIEVYKHGVLYETAQYPIAENNQGICEWDFKYITWKPFGSREQEAYAAYMTEKQVLESKDAEDLKE